MCRENLFWLRKRLISYWRHRQRILFFRTSEVFIHWKFQQSIFFISLSNFSLSVFIQVVFLNENSHDHQHNENISFNALFSGMVFNWRKKSILHQKNHITLANNYHFSIKNSLFRRTNKRNTNTYSPKCIWSFQLRMEKNKCKTEIVYFYSNTHKSNKNTKRKEIH